MRLIALQQTSR